MTSLLSIFKRGLKQLQTNPHLLYTLAIALLVVAAFVFSAFQFLAITHEAQDRLFNVRVGSIQDTFNAFVDEEMLRDPDVLHGHIDRIMADNPTLLRFEIMRSDGPVFVVAASSDPDRVGERLDPSIAYGAILGHVRSRSDTPFTRELQTSDGERLFTTVRALTNEGGWVIGAVGSVQTLSVADQRIGEQVRNTVLLLGLIIILVMVLFFRHARIVDYATLYRKLAEVDEMKDEFISMASHELRTPLSAIRGYTEILKESPSVGEEERKYLSVIDTSAQNLNTLVGDILDVSRLDQGRMDLDLKPLSLRGALDEVIDQLSVSAEEKGLVLEADHSVEDVRIEADPDRLRQVFVNIIGNAIKYTPEGRVTVSLSETETEVEVRVADTGIGMSADDQKRLFEKFYRVRSDETATIRGTGLGLWITKELVERMKGSISVESIKGEGTHFILRFPRLNDADPNGSDESGA